MGVLLETDLLGGDFLSTGLFCSGTLGPHLSSLLPILRLPSASSRVFLPLSTTLQLPLLAPCTGHHAVVWDSGPPRTGAVLWKAGLPRPVIVAHTCVTCGSPAPFPGLLLDSAHCNPVSHSKSWQGPSHVTQEARPALSRAQHILFAPVQSVAMLIMWQPRVLA